MIEKVKTRFDWLFSSHYKMERFGVTFSCLFLCMVFLVTSIGIRKIEMDRNTLGTNVIYTRSYTSSLAQSTGQLVNIFCSDDRTQCFVLLKFEDMTNVVADANQYQLFLCGSDLSQGYTELQSSPSAGIYMFGTTGYMGIYLVDVNGFPSQIVNLTVRCNTLVGKPPAELPVYEDASFSKHDQFTIYFNPGAADYTPAAFLNEGRMEMYDIYEEAVVRNQEATIRETLDADLEAMQSSLNLVSEYTARVESNGIIVPATPVQIRGDEIVETEDGRLQLLSDYTLAGGYNFDWYSGTVKDGYLKNLITDDTPPVEYLAKQKEQAAKERFSVANVEWLKSDGTVFDGVTNAEFSSEVAETQKNITALQTAWQEYYEAKRKYEVTDMTSLLVLEVQVDELSDNYTVNTEDVVTLY